VDLCAVHIGHGEKLFRYDYRLSGLQRILLESALYKDVQWDQSLILKALHENRRIYVVAVLPYPQKTVNMSLRILSALKLGKRILS
tara:strand:- start:597 stop:854 length:258 start_codon:yes stop_codon:yes gene_type:complete